MFLNRSSQYALEVVLYLSRHPQKRFVRLNEVAQELDLSYHFLGKIAQMLVKNKILISVRGPKGGFGFSDPDRVITQLEVIQATQEMQPLSQCVLRPKECDKDNPCPLHPTWEKIMSSVKDALNETSMK